MKKIVFGLVLILFVLVLAQAQIYKDPSATVEARVADLLSRMTIDEKIGQMTQPDRAYVTTTDLKTYFIGSVLSGGGSVPANNTPAGWADFYDSLQNAALSTRLGIPIIYGIDAVHGNNNVKNAVIFPHNIGLGCANDTSLMERIGTVVANEVAATGVDWTFAPCVAVVRNERWGRTYEGFSEDPLIVSNLTAPYINGFQGATATMQGEKIVACAKHFVGDGGTLDGINMGNTIIDEAGLRSIHLPPYYNALSANVGTVMISYSSWNSERLHGHKYLVTDVLKTEMGFKGFIVSDWNGIKDLPGTYRDQVKASINAGLDMIMAPLTADWQGFITNMKDLVNTGEIPVSRVDDAVKRILTIKFKAGLFETPLTDRTLATDFGSTAHREVAREAVRKSLVLLKNNNNILPLSKTAKIFVAGKSANSLVNQCGGWTINWQGMTSDSQTTGTTILTAMQKVNPNITFSATGTGAAGNTVAVIFIGETPYAEGEGDRTDLGLDSTDLTAISNVTASGVPYVLVLVSGRPMTMTTQINAASAFVAAWLPGTEGTGVADVLFGDYNFTGKLSYTWPNTMSQIPINNGDAVYSPLYAYGYGLTYGGATATATATSLVTPTRSATRTATTTTGATATRTGTATRTATATRSATATLTRSPTGIIATATRTATTAVTRTATSVATRTATSAATRTTTSGTPTPTISGCTCDAGCTTRTVITPNFSKDGSGSFCYEASSLGSYINSWNLVTLEVNGVDFTNKWTAKASLPAAIGGLYYVYYNSTVSYGHFEAMN